MQFQPWWTRKSTILLWHSSLGQWCSGHCIISWQPLPSKNIKDIASIGLVRSVQTGRKLCSWAVMVYNQGQTGNRSLRRRLEGKVCLASRSFSLLSQHCPLYLTPAFYYLDQFRTSFTFSPSFLPTTHTFRNPKLYQHFLGPFKIYMFSFIVVKLVRK